MNVHAKKRECNEHRESGGFETSRIRRIRDERSCEET